MAVRTGVLTVLSFAYEEDNAFSSEQSGKMTDWTQSESFYSQFVNDALNAVSRVTYDDDYKEIKKKLLDNKDKIINEAYKQVVDLKNSYQTEYEADLADGYEEYEEYSDDETQTTTAVSKEQFETFNESDPREAIFSVEASNTYYADMPVYSNDTKETLSKRFDENYENWVDEALYNFDSNDYRASNESCYYSSFKKLKEKNTEEFSESAVLNSDIYYILKNGKAEFKGIDKNVADSVTARINGATKFADKVTLYLYIPSVKDLNKTGIAATISRTSNEYSLIKEFHGVADKYYKNSTKYAAVSIVLLVLSFIFGIYYFTITGKKREGRPSKLIFYDYVPLEIGLGIAGAAGVGAGALLVSLIDSRLIIPYSMITAYGMLAFACVCWVGLFMVCASSARYIGSDKKFYTHLLTYWVFFALWKVLVFIFRLLIKLAKKAGAFFKKIFDKIKSLTSLLSYKPTKFKRNIIIIAGILFLIHILLVFFGVLFAFINEAAFAAVVISFLIALAIDVAVLYRVANYIKNLDIIIDASSRHEDITLDLETLDNSLRILAESMRYTNAELQNAINKAVKDERLRTELITNVSHDLKTPLTSIITYVDLLSKCNIEDEKAQEYIKVLDEKGAKLKRLIDDLIEASKVTSGNITINPSVMNLSELCLQATVDAQTDFEKAGLELIVKQGEKPVIVFADGTKTNRIIENLLSNARKYSAKASRVYVNVYEENGCGVFEIKNISARALDITPEELTERFVRGDESRSQEGNGLGLSIAKELAALQSGRLELSIDGDLFKAKVILPIK
jgi:signal transduction histidine kinase